MRLVEPVIRVSVETVKKESLTPLPGSHWEALPIHERCTSGCAFSPALPAKPLEGTISHRIPPSTLPNIGSFQRHIYNDEGDSNCGEVRWAFSIAFDSTENGR